MTFSARPERCVARNRSCSCRAAGTASPRPRHRTSPMPSLEELLGAHVVNAKGEKVPSASLAQNDCIGLYFSAHWCVPPRTFARRMRRHSRRARAGVALAASSRRCSSRRTTSSRPPARSSRFVPLSPRCIAPDLPMHLLHGCLRCVRRELRWSRVTPSVFLRASHTCVSLSSSTCALFLCGNVVCAASVNSNISMQLTCTPPGCVCQRRPRREAVQRVLRQHALVRVRRPLAALCQ